MSTSHQIWILLKVDYFISGFIINRGVFRSPRLPKRKKGEKMGESKKIIRKSRKEGKINKSLKFLPKFRHFCIRRAGDKRIRRASRALFWYNFRAAKDSIVHQWSLDEKGK